MTINKNNVFYQNRSSIAQVCGSRSVDVGVGTQIWADESKCDYTPADLREWNEILVYYQRHKALTLADLFA